MSWTVLALELKQDIIGLVDYETRCHLRLCSKADRDTVDSTKITAKNMKISEIKSEMAPRKTIIRIDIDSFTIWFIGRENVTRINRGWNGEVIEELSEMKQVNRYELVTQFFHRIIRNRFVKAETLRIDCVLFPPPESFKIKSDNLIFNEISHEFYIPWLRKCLTIGKKFKKLECNCWAAEGDLTDLLPEIQISESLRIDHDIELTDEQLDRIEATDLKITSTRITANAAKRRILHFLKNGKRNDKLELYIELHANLHYETDILEGLVLSKIKKHIYEEYNGKILGGFKNIHGIQNAREVDFSLTWNLLRMYCGIPEKPEKKPHRLYPF